MSDYESEVLRLLRQIRTAAVIIAGLAGFVVAASYAPGLFDWLSTEPLLATSVLLTLLVAAGLVFAVWLGFRSLGHNSVATRSSNKSA